MAVLSLTDCSGSRSSVRALAAKIAASFLAALCALLAFGAFSSLEASAEPFFSIFVSGRVTDMITGSPIPKATVAFPEKGVVIEANDRGELPPTEIRIEREVDELKLTVEAKGYRGEIGSARVYPGARLKIDSQLVSSGYPGKIVVSREAELAAAVFDGDPASLGEGNPLPGALDGGASGIASSIQGLFSAQALSSSGIPQTIRVYRVNLGRVDVVPFDFYVKHVLPSEWYGSWPMESLKAGAMGVKTYAWYWIARGGKWPSLGADVKDTTADQVYNPNYSYPTTDDAVDATWNFKMTRGGSLFESHYLAGSYGPGYVPGYEGWMTQWGTKYWADQGKDWRWILHYYYDPYGTISINPVKKAASDFNGDGASDPVSAYNYGAGTTGIWVFLSDGQTLRSLLWWRSGPGYFDFNRAKWVSGDFNGDGYADAIALYDYGGTKSGLWLFASTGSGFAQPKLVFASDHWSSGQTKLASGDFDGDGKDELLALYGYGGTSTGVWLIDELDRGSTYLRRAFYSSYWDWAKTKLVSGDFDGNGAVDAGAIYEYGSTSTGFWVFPFESGGQASYPYRAYFSAFWAASSARYLSGDVNADGKDDLIAAYNYGAAKTGIWFFSSSGSKFEPVLACSAPLDYSRSAFISGDFTGDGLADAAAVYDYGGGKMGIRLFSSDGSTISSAKEIYTSPYWDNSSAVWLNAYR